MYCAMHTDDCIAAKEDITVYMLHSFQQCVSQISLDTSLNPVFMTAIEMIDDETYLGADGRHLFICQKNRSVDVLCHLACGI